MTKSTSLLEMSFQEKTSYKVNAKCRISVYKENVIFTNTFFSIRRRTFILTPSPVICFIVVAYETSNTEIITKIFIPSSKTLNKLLKL